MQRYEREVREDVLVTEISRTKGTEKGYLSKEQPQKGKERKERRKKGEERKQARCRERKSTETDLRLARSLCAFVSRATRVLGVTMALFNGKRHVEGTLYYVVAFKSKTTRYIHQRDAGWIMVECNSETNDPTQIGPSSLIGR